MARGKDCKQCTAILAAERLQNDLMAGGEIMRRRKDETECEESRKAPPRKSEALVKADCTMNSG